MYEAVEEVSILILLDYLFLSGVGIYSETPGIRSFNPYFIGLPILIRFELIDARVWVLFQSLFYWITYSYPFCRESSLFITVTEFFSDIKIFFFSIFLVIFC